MKQYTPLIIAFLAVSATARAEAVRNPDNELARVEKMSMDEIYAYNSTPDKKMDPAGDCALYRRAMKSLDFVPDILTGKMGMAHPSEPFDPGEPREVPGWTCCTPKTTEPLDLSKTIGLSEQETAELMAELENRALSIQGRERPVKRRGINEMFAQVIDEERRNGIEPSVGTPHTWSPEFLDKYRGTPVAQFSKLLVALAFGRTWSLLPTGNETALRDWILEQPENSITIAELFRTSYRLNGGTSIRRSSPSKACLPGIGVMPSAKDSRRRGSFRRS